MDPLLATLVLILVALLGARVTFSTARAPAGPRLLLRTGTLFLLVGFGLGPVGLGLLPQEATRQLFPMLALGLGWVGFHFGLQLDRQALSLFPWTHHVLAIGQAALTFGLFFAATWGVARLAGFEGNVPLIVALIASCTASVTTPAGIAMVSSNFLVKGTVRDLLFFVSSLDAIVGIVALQIVYASFRQEAVADELLGVPHLVFVALAMGLGLICGIVFLWLIRARTASEELILYLLGICAFAAGAALQWGLSPLFVSVTMGAVVANLARERQRILLVLERWEKPVYLTFLLIAGALLRFPTWWVLPIAVAYALLRVLAKTAGTAAMVSVLPLPDDVPRRLGIGLIPQGGISIAMAVSGTLIYSDMLVGTVDAEEVLFAVIVIGVLLSELTGPFVTIRLLRQTGAISPRVVEALEAGDERAAEKEAIRHAVVPEAAEAAEGGEAPEGADPVAPDPQRRERSGGDEGSSDGRWGGPA